MSLDLNLIIESEFDMFTDRHAKKRGPRHRQQDVGLNLNRKHQNIIAKVHKADPNEVKQVEALRGGNGRKFVTFQVGQQLKQKYGLQTDNGYLGTTGIRLIKTDKGYDLIKEATVLYEGEKFVINNPDDIFESPFAGSTFGVHNGVVYYVEGFRTHYELFEDLIALSRGKQNYVKTFPKLKSVEPVKALLNTWGQFFSKWKETATEIDVEHWGNFGNIREFFQLSGRTTQAAVNTAAFWNRIEQVNQFQQLLNGFFSTIGLQDPTIVALDAKDTKLGKTNKVQPKNTVDQEILKKQHLVPALKKAGGGGGGNAPQMQVGSGKLGTAAHRAGYKNSAEYDHGRIVGDSVEHDSNEETTE